MPHWVHSGETSVKTLHLPGLLFLPRQDRGPRDEPNMYDQNHDNKTHEICWLIMPKSNNADDYLCNNMGPRTSKTKMKTMIMMIIYLSSLIPVKQQHLQRLGIEVNFREFTCTITRISWLNTGIIITWYTWNLSYDVTTESASDKKMIHKARYELCKWDVTPKIHFWCREVLGVEAGKHERKTGPKGSCRDCRGIIQICFGRAKTISQNIPCSNASTRFVHKIQVFTMQSRDVFLLWATRFHEWDSFMHDTAYFDNYCNQLHGNIGSSIYLKQYVFSGQSAFKSILII